MIVVFMVAGRFEIMERVVEYARHHESWQLDELIVVSVYLVAALSFFSIQRWRESWIAGKKLMERNEELEKALTEIKQLTGIIPICAACKKIRCDEGFWHQVEVYICNHTDAEFTHGICPDCIKKLYPDLVPEDGNIR
jgi:hypothetical protein